MLHVRGEKHPPLPLWSRQKILALLIVAGVCAVLLVTGLVLAVAYGVHPQQRTADHGPASSTAPASRTDGSVHSTTLVDPRDALANRPMPSVGEDASHPGPVSTTDPGPSITLPAASTTGPGGVPTGFPHTPFGALVQLAAIDQTALQSGSLAGARAVISGWALPGGPTTSNWSGVRAMAEFFDAAGLSGGGNTRLAIAATPLMGLIKGSVGTDFVVPCVDLEIDVTLAQTARGAAADCQRMVWIDTPAGGRWMIGPGAEPAPAPSVWPDTDIAIAVGYRDLRPDTTR